MNENIEWYLTLVDTHLISLEFRNLSKVYQDVIADVCRRMGAGMAELLQRKVDSLHDWDKVWSRYAKELSDLAKPENIDAAVQCLNELITNALQHIPDVLTYLSRLKNQRLFNFCAIPQVMAIATLAACYNNKQVFRGVVKIRKGQVVTLMMDATNMQAVKAIMYQYVGEVGLVSWFQRLIIRCRGFLFNAQCSAVRAKLGFHYNQLIKQFSIFQFALSKIAEDQAVSYCTCFLK
ncbi:squalene synthase-like [Emydura macquarii macquarii]|uniref:squalene synthase-like n=1 Tax=Emydura macquarii macquarii TaxID=1129001 RepID=UPI00352B0371